LGEVGGDIKTPKPRSLGVGNVRRDPLVPQSRGIKEFPRQLVVGALEYGIDHAPHKAKPVPSTLIGTQTIHFQLNTIHE
jgi:hypothetical protein